MNTFLGYNFKKLEISDNKILYDFLYKYNLPLAGYTFPILIGWNDAFSYEWCFIDNECLLLSCIVDDTNHRHLLQPIGILSEKTGNILAKKIKEVPYSLKFFGITLDFLEKNMNFVAKFNLREDDGGGNYIYSAEDLAFLKGRKFQKKRNLISQATKLYTWSVEKINQNNTEECLNLLQEMDTDDNKEQHIDEENIRLLVEGESVVNAQKEKKAVIFILNNYSIIQQEGILIRINNKVEAFSIYEKTSSTNAICHIEKASRKYKGSYQIINNEVAKILYEEGIKTINREEDLGDEGLKKAKLSYCPTHIIPSFYMCTCPHMFQLETKENILTQISCNRGW